jgi:predicted oxidoreductase
MQDISLGVSTLRSSRLAFGCWRVAGSGSPAEIGAQSRAAGYRAIIAAYEAGYTLFDNADIYSGGESERILGETLKKVSGMRDRILVATKCGIVPGGDPDSPPRYDFSFSHIIEACERSLSRLGIETIDIYLLHRPDYLANPEEVSRAFSELKAAGKVRWFGVSNFRPSLVTALQVACPMPLLVHQVEISLSQIAPFVDGTLDQCLIEKMTPLAWSPLAGGLLASGARTLLPAQQCYQPSKILPVLDSIAKARSTTRAVVALAWLLKHPSNILPIIGSIQPERIREAAKAPELQLTREEWYRLLIAARGEPLP